MANRTKGITVEIGGDTTKLSKALDSVNKNIKNTQTQLKDGEKLLKLDPTNTEFLAQKQKLLKDAISDTKEKLSTLKTAAEQANEALANGDISKEQYDALQREIVETEQDLKKLEEQAVNSSTALQKISAAGEKMTAIGDKISSAGTKLLPVTAGITALGTAAVSMASNFESSMSQVQATMGITKDAMSNVNGQSVNTMDTLSALAKKMGSETAFSASDCADALNYLVLAGYNTEQMCDTLPTVLNLVATGNIDLATASDMVTDAMSALGMGVDESEKMVDQMAKTASSTNTSVAQLGEGILTIGATAKSIKGGTAELNTALGILANNGIKGAEGGTHLRNVILSLQSPTDTATACMEQLGVDIYDSEGNMCSLNDILGDLNKSMEGMTSSDKNNIINTIFNKTDLSSVNALLANTGETWGDLQQSIIDSGGAAQQMADTQLDNLSGQITILKSALEGLAISFGELLMPVIKQVVDVIQKMVDKLNALDPSMKETIVKIALIVATIGPLLIMVGKVISSVGSILSLVGKIPSMITAVQGGITALTGALGVSMGVILAIVATIATLVAAFVHLWNTNEDFKNSILSIWENIQATFECLTSGIVDRLNALGFNFESFGDVVKAVWDALCNVLAPVFEDVFNQIANIFDTVTDVILGVLDVFIGLFTGNWDQCWSGINGIFTGIWDFIKNTFSNILNALKGIADVFLGWFGTS
jgi:TP901 family phage tail tape measure protein